ncbi:MAG TPA: ABC transporter substrate binding protein [Silvibacterium sp.]|nr:ABC transporter substrate binding protein [Silvibacterium sp.]
MQEVRRVLIIYETGPSTLSFHLIDQQLRSTLDDQSPYLVEIYTESMETGLFPDEASQQQIREAYIRKYKDQKLDLIIAAGPSPIQFMVESHESHFKNVPVVFCGATREQVGNLPFNPYFTGVWLTWDPARTLDAALRLLPDTKHVVVVGGAGLYDRELEAAVQKSLTPYEHQVEITYLTDLAMPALLDRLEQLPRDSIVLFTTIQRDAAGTYFPRAVSVANASVANAPIFVLFDTLMGYGTIGGYVSSFAGQGREAGKMASRILNGEKPQDIATVAGTNAYIFDWRQLQRWGIPESRIPVESTILFRAPTDWEKYKYKIISVLAVVAAQTAFMLLLIWLIKRRIRAQQVLERQLVVKEISHLNQVASMGHMAASLAHELAQPLGAILSNAQAAEHLASRPSPDSGEIRAALTDIREDDKRARAVLENMRAIFKKQTIALYEVDLNEIAHGVSRMVRNDAQLRGVELRLMLSTSALRVQGSVVPLQQVVLNLINNGMDAMQDLPQNRRVLTVTTCVRADMNSGMILVEDNGPGIADRNKVKVFMPFFTTKTEGLGMGLSICRSILDSLGGRISFDNRPGGGSTFRVELPLAVARDLVYRPMSA